MAATGPILSWYDDHGEPHTLDLSAASGELTVGRRESNDVALPWDDHASRLHAQLERVGTEWTIRDDGLSHNGTKVNGAPLIGRRRLLDGDQLEVGQTLIDVRAPSAVDSQPTRGAGPNEALARSAARVTVRLFGPLVLAIDGERRESQFAGRMGRRLFAYLVMQAGRTARRDELIEVLWPRKLPPSPEAALSVHLTRLRRVLGDRLSVGRADVSLDLGADADVDLDAAQRWALEARAELRAGRMTEALGAARAARAILETGALLPEFIDEDWAAQRKLEVDDLLPDLLEIEAEAALVVGGGELPAAEAAATALLELRPYRESDHRLLMRAHAAQGNRALALVVYDRLRQQLMDELGIPPPAETRALYEQLLAEQAGPSAPAAS